jgi:virginiamycin B lyase
MNKTVRLMTFIAVPLLVAIALTIVVASSETAEASTAEPLLVEYPVPGSPKRIAVESAGRVWFTLVDQNMIGNLIVTSTIDYKVITYTVPTTNSQPYDLTYVGSMVWFTEHAGNKIGRLDPSTSTIDEFSVPSPASGPAGIDVAPNGTVWFVEKDGNNLARLTVTSTVDYVVDEFAIVDDDDDPLPNAEPEGIDIQDDNNIWFTAPEVDRLMVYQPNTGSFFDFPSGGGSTPWDVVVPNAWPWITAYDADLIGRYSPQTTGDYTWFSVENGSGPTGIAFDSVSGVNRTWYAAKDSGEVGRLDTNASQGTRIGVTQFPLPTPNSQPEGIAVDSSGHAWIAETGANRIAEWRPPYMLSIYLPLVLRQ